MKKNLGSQVKFPRYYSLNRLYDNKQGIQTIGGPPAVSDQSISLDISISVVHVYEYIKIMK